MMYAQKTNTEVKAYDARTIWLQAALVAAFCGCTKEVLGLWSGRRGRCPGRTLGATMTLFE